MSSSTSSFRGRRQAARSERAIRRAIDSAASPSMRDELIVLHQRTMNGLSR